MAEEIQGEFLIVGYVDSWIRKTMTILQRLWENWLPYWRRSVGPVMQVLPEKLLTN